MELMKRLAAICPACRATCGLAAPEQALITTLCDAHREYAERRVVKPEPAYAWRKPGDLWSA